MKPIDAGGVRIQPLRFIVRDVALSYDEDGSITVRAEAEVIDRRTRKMPTKISLSDTFPPHVTESQAIASTLRQLFAHEVEECLTTRGGVLLYDAHA